MVQPFPVIRLKGGVSIESPRGNPKTKLTGGRPEINDQADNNDGERHKVQPERFVMLWTHKVRCTHILGLDVRIGTSLGTDQSTNDLGSCEIWCLPNRRPKKSEDNKLRL